MSLHKSCVYGGFGEVVHLNAAIVFFLLLLVCGRIFSSRKGTLLIDKIQSIILSNSWKWVYKANITPVSMKLLKPQATKFYVAFKGGNLLLRETVTTLKSTSFRASFILMCDKCSCMALYISSSSSSSCRSASTDIPDSLSPLFSIVHRLW